MKVLNSLQKIMYEKQLTYRQLEHMTGVSHNTLNKIAIGATSPTQKTMISIARGLHMEVADIFELK